jgi:hypothetical protein
MQKWNISISVCLLILLLPEKSSATYKPFIFVLHSQCPTNNPKNSWKDYLMGKFKPESNPEPKYPNAQGPWLRYSGQVGVQFRNAKAVNDRSALPNIDPAACYGVQWMQNRPGFPNGYLSMRSFGYERMDQSGFHDNQIMKGLPGNPENYEINVGGNILKFNEGGEVFDLRGHAVGTLVCYRSNECNKYGY